jgi:hypothetical protein
MTEKKKTKKKAKPANNVVQFPQKQGHFPEISIELIQANKNVVREIHIEETMELVMPMLFDNINLMGFNFSKKVDLAKDINLVFESVNSLLRKYYQMEHGLQDVADQFFILPKEMVEEDNKE